MKILVGYRGTNVGQDLLELARKHAMAFEGEVIIVTSLIGGDKTTNEQVIEAEDLLDEAKTYFDEKKIDCETHLLVRGYSAGEDIVRYAEEKEVDQILIGVKSRSKVGKLIFGSTAQYVILKAPCPVTTVR
ncbi:universal stress protein [Desulfopila sp. IMCC35008]|uniref:universal stress protein n=1 Tax=Desulfopila sp. IMCC35008 TaxID=2653858 RepID=UPI0013D5CC30|nr:universal stress protein [Desulfopila sp. IMCC35008]